MKRMLAAAAAVILVAGASGARRGADQDGGGTTSAVAADAGGARSFLGAAPLAAPAITVDSPVEGTIFPPDLAPPLFAWRDTNPAATVWRIEVAFGEHARHVQVWSAGEKMQIRPVDASLVGYVPPTLTPQQAAAHTWRPDAKTWAEIKKHSVKQAATVIVTGYPGEHGSKPVSRGQTTLQTSQDPVGAPIFYRDVPLLPPPADAGERGVIKPLPDSVLPKIKWRLRNVSETESRTVMEGLPTCANCHSISRDGKTMGIDVDGPENDKGLYAMIPLKKISTISNDYVIHWSAFSEERAQKRFGFMSQISPDGKNVVTSIDVPHAHGTRVVDRLYNGFYNNYGFGQVFYPTRGVLGWYSKDTGKLAPLPGADDPNFVQTAGFWSPDGKYIVFSRAVARHPYVAGQPRSTYANSPDETQIQYDLYRIPFNDGKGGTPERIVGASENGMSNDFPKVSPDGKWIVFVQNKNGLLMRPDSKLYIVPFEGGAARPLRSNQPVMNSWHSFSPNGRWLVFSSKTPSLYTQMYLTHMDGDGTSSPAVLVENATASNRAVNIPEFMNIAPDGLERIDTPAIDFYKMFDTAVQLADKHQYDAAVPAWKKALEMDPSDSRAHNNLGIALTASGKSSEAISEYKASLALNDASSQTQNNLGSALAEEGNLEEAIPHLRKAVELNPDNAEAHVNLGNALASRGGNADEAMAELTKGLQMQPASADGQNGLGVALARSGKLEEAIPHLQKGVELAPQSAGYRYNLGRVLAAKGRFADAVPQFEAAAKLSGGQDPGVLQMLAAMYSETGRYGEAAATARQALELAVQQKSDALATALRASIDRYDAQAAAKP